MLFLPSNPASVGAMGEEIRSALLQAQVANDTINGDSTPVAPAVPVDGDGNSQENIERLRNEAKERARRAREEARRRAEEAASSTREHMGDAGPDF